jgi:hypothetical protein
VKTRSTRSGAGAARGTVRVDAVSPHVMFTRALSRVLAQDRLLTPSSRTLSPAD